MNLPLSQLKQYSSIFLKLLGSGVYLTYFLVAIAVFAEGVGLTIAIPFILEILGNGYDSTKLIKFYGYNLTILYKDAVIIIIILVIIKSLLIFVSQALVANYKSKLHYIFKKKISSSLANINYQYFQAKNRSHYVNVFFEQTNLAVGAFSHLVGVSAQIISVVIYLLFALFTSFYFGVAAMSIGFLLIILFRKLNGYIRKLSREGVKQNSKLASYFIQRLDGYKYLFATNQLAKFLKKEEMSIRKLTNMQRVSGYFSAFTRAIKEPLGFLLLFSLIIFFTYDIESNISHILVSVALFYKAYSVMMGLQNKWQTTMEIIGSVEVVDSEINDLSTNLYNSNNRTKAPKDFNIEFIDVGFTHINNPQPTLNNITFNLPHLATLAIVGPSGAGKSTLVDLITGLLEPTTGQILINGYDISTINMQEFRNSIGYVTQDSILFNDSIANNITMDLGAKSIDEHTLSKVTEAAKLAHINEFILTLDKGYCHEIGDKGTVLSGGQKQRLFLARELFRNPNLLILDEATSALDMVSEGFIIETLAALKGKITVIIIAHRISTIRHADRVLVISDGSIVQDDALDVLKNYGYVKDVLSLS